MPNYSTNSSNYTLSLWLLSLRGPSGSQGLDASSWQGWGTWDSWDTWPPGLQQSTHHHQQPTKRKGFPFETHWKCLQVPSRHSNCFIFKYKTELFFFSVTFYNYFLQLMIWLVNLIYDLALKSWKRCPPWYPVWKCLDWEQFCLSDHVSCGDMIITDCCESYSSKQEQVFSSNTLIQIFETWKKFPPLVLMVPKGLSRDFGLSN